MEDIDAIVEGVCLKLVKDGVIEGFTALVLMNGGERFFDALQAKLQERFGGGYSSVVKLRLKSYRGTQCSGKVDGLELLDIDRLGEKVVIFDDILDTGTTLSALLEVFDQAREKGVLSEVYSCVLFWKLIEHCEQKATCDYHGATIEDRFVVGYGLDYDGDYRELDGLYVLEG